MCILTAIPYTIKVKTGPQRDMGTESRVWIKIYGPKNRTTGTQHLELFGKKGFKPGSTETFSLDAPDVGDVKKIEVSLKSAVERDYLV